MKGNRCLIGVFDSGIGGLTVLNDCVRGFPAADYLYLGDNANAPYGNKSEEEIARLVQNGVRTLVRAGVDGVVLACNTATAICAQLLRREFALPILGVEPAVLPAARACKNVLVLCTPRTARSERLSALILQRPDCRFTVHGCERLAGIIEAGGGRVERAELYAQLPQGCFDGVVLGCTHYLFVKEEIGSFYSAPTFDGNQGLIRRLSQLFSGKMGKGQGLTTTEWEKVGIRDHFWENPKIRSQNPSNLGENSQNSVIFFLGKEKTFNKTRYEQMFIFKNG